MAWTTPLPVPKSPASSISSSIFTYESTNLENQTTANVSQSTSSPFLEAVQHKATEWVNIDWNTTEFAWHLGNIQLLNVSSLQVRTITN